MSDDNQKQFVRQVGKYKVVVVPGKCIAAASCIAISPEVFELNEDNIAEIVENPNDTEDNIMLAAQSCPTGAIEIYEEDPADPSGQGKRVWPL